MKNEQIYYSERQKKRYFRFMLWVIGWAYWLVGHGYFRLMPRTTINQEVFDHIDNQPLKGILVPWHAYIIYGMWMCRNRGGAAMVSQSNIGSVAAAIIARLGCIPVRGGSRFGGIASLIKIIDYVLMGRWGLIAADGPRGPIHVCAMGPIIAAQRTGRPIVPVAFAAKRKWTLNNWDKTIIPKPFSPIVWMYGHPIFIPRDLDREGLMAKRLELENILKENHKKAMACWNQDEDV